METEREVVKEVSAVAIAGGGRCEVRSIKVASKRALPRIASPTTAAGPPEALSPLEPEAGTFAVNMACELLHVQLSFP